MSGQKSLQIVLAERPKGEIIPGQTLVEQEVPAPRVEDLKDGEVLLETLYLSLDPAMRGWMNDQRSYIPPVPLGSPMRGATLSRVLASKSSRAKPGDVVQSYQGWQELAILQSSPIPGVGLAPFDDPFVMPDAVADQKEQIRPVDLLGVLGSTGLTAYFGVEKIADIKPGDTVVVSGAAGATGSVVGQIAKKVKGAGKVVGIAGGAEKCKYLVDELGFDVALDYKDEKFKDKFEEATEGFIDVFWDNVGGEILDMALTRANKGARFVMCGSISQYNAEKKYGIQNLTQVTQQRIKMQGFIVFDFMAEYASARKDLARWLAEGKLKRSETIIKGGLKKAPQALVDLYKGINTGKLLVEIKNPDAPSRL